MRTASELTTAGTASRAPWADLGPSELVDHLEAVHHAYLHDELPRLTALAENNLLFSGVLALEAERSG